MVTPAGLANMIIDANLMKKFQYHTIFSQKCHSLGESFLNFFPLKGDLTLWIFNKQPDASQIHPAENIKLVIEIYYGQRIMIFAASLLPPSADTVTT